MTLRLTRHPSGATSTIGELCEIEQGIPSPRWAWTCEDVIREIPGVPVSQWKVQGETAIPEGTYQVLITPSVRFHGMLLPELLHVPGFSGIRIHPGNTSADTEGCLLPGFDTDGTTVSHSRQAFALVKMRIEEAINQGDRVYLEIRNP